MSRKLLKPKEANRLLNNPETSQKDIFLKMKKAYDNPTPITVGTAHLTTK